MNLVAALIYWVIVAIWTATLTTIIVLYVRNPRAFGTTRLLLTVIAIDTARNIVENIYFGLYFGSRYELLPAGLAAVLGNPYLLIVPKLINVVAGCVVLGLLLGRWLPAAVLERRTSDKTADSLRSIAALDGMTGLFNKTHFNTLGEVEWERSRRHSRSLSCLMVDIDFFKLVNDRHGHEVGDRLLVQIAHACRDHQRRSDIVARLGGEEFALLLPETDLEGAAIAAERLRDAISRNVLALPEEIIKVTASIGVSEARQGDSLTDLLKHADMALYEAKRHGRNRVCLYKSSEQRLLQIAG